MNIDFALAIVKDHIRIGKGMDIEMYQVPEALEMVVEELGQYKRALEICVSKDEIALDSCPFYEYPLDLCVCDSAEKVASCWIKYWLDQAKVGVPNAD